MDPLSDVFSLLNVRALASARFEASGKWAVRFPEQNYLKFGAAVRGDYWLKFDDEPPRQIKEGETHIMVNCPTYSIASDLSQPELDGAALYFESGTGAVRLNGDDVVILGGGFGVDEVSAGFLVDILPRFISVAATSPASTFLRNTLQTLDKELSEKRIGNAVITNRLGEILLVQALRAYAEDSPPSGWLGAIQHPKIGKSLIMMHADIARPWTIEELAQDAAMSRSDFARKFKDVVGLPPVEYLIRWRMYVARNALRNGEASVASVAASTGYSSESAFGNAFKRVFGRAPKRYWSHVV
jgi:AraC-like DNA-binding protein